MANRSFKRSISIGANLPHIHPTTTNCKLIRGRGMSFQVPLRQTSLQP